MAYEELIRMAEKNALDAIRLDKQGAARLAAAKYQRAAEILLTVCSLYPKSPQSRVYAEKAEAYLRRVKELQNLSLESATSGTSLPSLKKTGSPLKDRPNVRWEDIADLEDAKRAIREAIVYPVKRPDLFPLGWPRGILFFGPPGCGKTMLAAAVANEVDAHFFYVDSATIMSKWLGESEKNVAALFENARELSHEGKPAIIFIDEIDSLVGVRSHEVGGEVRARNQLLKEMDGLQDKGKNLYVYVIGATNKPWNLDEPFIRRFQRRIYIPPPDFRARLELFKIYCRNLKLSRDVDLEELARLTEGYTGSDIRDIAQEAQVRVVREYFERDGGDVRAITMNDFLELLRHRKPSVSRENVRRYEEWWEKFKAV
ncbi:MAG: ATPase AAA [Candidatus Bathyarchaeota archaeon B24]|nr:MAG: ATPase AAA [Candidatus Bathyarchaeota archaeon B24]